MENTDLAGGVLASERITSAVRASATAEGCQVTVSIGIAAGNARDADALVRAWWARTLNLSDPSGDGARRVAAAQTWLQENKLLEVRRLPGQEPLVRLKSADGEGRAWKRPSSHYVTIPVKFWTNRWIWMLTAKEIAVPICMIDFIGGRGEQASDEGENWMRSDERARYTLSPDTWRLASD